MGGWGSDVLIGRGAHNPAPCEWVPGAERAVEHNDRLSSGVTADNTGLCTTSTHFKNHRVEVADSKEGVVVADAVRFVSVDGSTSGLLYVHADHLGTPQKMTDGSQTLVWDAVYKPFGEGHSITGTATNNQRFPGQYFDAESDFHYNFFRDYDPRIGRYVESDPIGQRGGLNLFKYVGGNPIRWFDPNGLTKLTFTPAAGTLTVDPEQSGNPPYTIPASSGVPGEDGCLNNPACSDKKNKGPIPPGTFFANTSALTNPGAVGDLLRNRTGDWGDGRVPLVPSPGTNTLGRSGFFMHGGSRPGTAGCIDVGGGVFGNDTTDQLLNDLLSDPDGIIPITVQ